ncbi:putative glycosyltransferase [Fragilariopsis cylindrus CCMP1102]|uniref:Thymidine phosphorylase n=1 Tax=Fragilariopsis cylindrus CCMP1102 TaxID=635003 RepID=A0A1E7F2H7_9STRA|nr:putative glycosyltransferase [Fragilariopsis cylindrus CCMP1102]|eukprot:OEU12339.1 putative glycosyltransferase [Fragilariopsis cylindrus CCMP1102]
MGIKNSVVNPVEIIARARLRRNGNSSDHNISDDDGIYTDHELHCFITQYAEGTIPDYQMSAWLMAICFNPLTPRETATLTRCYAESGMLLSWPEKEQRNDNNQKRQQRPPLVDKHSSGGVGDKISLILAPLVATCGVCVPMMAGRGLGHTGGTIDKLETSFPGYTAEPSVQDFQQIVLGEAIMGQQHATVTTIDRYSEPVGCAIVAAGPELCPADRRIYALRDVTSTVSCLPLQTASIMSKKIAERPDSLVLDVKYGHGAFQANVEDAQLLAESMVDVGEANGLIPTTAFLTNMDFPIGRAVGNWVEVEECIDVLKGNLKDERLRLSQDLIALVVIQAGQMLYQSDRRGHNIDTTANNDVLDSGRALNKIRQMLLAQGAEPIHLQRALDTPGDIPLATFVACWTYEETANTSAAATTADINTSAVACYVIDDIPAKTIGDVGVMVGAGRTVAGEKVDGQAGLVFYKQVGDSVKGGEIIVKIFTNRSQEIADAALQRVQEAVQVRLGIVETDTRRRPIVTHRVTKEGGTEPFIMPEL